MSMDRSSLRLLASVVGTLAIFAQDVQAQAQTGKIPITTSSAEAREEFEKGYALGQDFQPKEAAKHYAKAVELDPTFALAEMGLANTLPTAKDFFEHIGKAVALAEKASEGERLWILGVQAGGTGEPQKQLESYQKLVALHPNDERAHLLLGLLQFGRSDFNAAIDELNAVAKLAPTFAGAQNMLGYSYRAIENYPEAEKAFKRYAEMLPDNPNPYDSYAELLLKLGRHDESIVQYRKALEVDPHYVASDYGIASNLAYQGKHEEALKQLQKSYDTSRDDGERRGALAVMAAVHVDQGKYDDAVKQVQNMQDLAEKIHDASNASGDLALMGTILLEGGKPDEALAKFEASAKVVETSALSDDVKQNTKRGLLFGQGRVALAKHDLATAKAKAQDFLAQATASQNVFQVRAAHQLAGLIALEEKEYDKAIAELKQTNPLDPFSMFRLAQAYEGKGDAAQAKATYEKVAKFNVLVTPNFAFVRTKAVQKLAAGS